MIKIFREPTVYLLGRQEQDQAQMQKFLSDHGVSWSTDTEIGAEALVETAGRLCFDDRTDVLTQTGWVRLADLGEGEAVATLNPATRDFEFQIPSQIHVYDYHGDLYEVNGRDVSFAVTPEHRVLAGLGKKSGFAAFEMHEARSLVGKRFRVLTAPSGWRGTVADSVEIPGVEWSQVNANKFGVYGSRVGVLASKSIGTVDAVISLAKLATHYAANGSVCDQAESGNGVVIYGREVKEVRALAAALDWPTHVWTDPRNGCPRTIIGGGRIVANWFEEECGRGFINKKLPRFVLDLPSNLLREIWEILVKTDGHRDADGQEFFLSGSRQLADQAQEILAKLGFSSSMGAIKGTNGPCNVVTKKLGRPAVVQPRKLQKVSYRGKVFCVTTENGVVYVRRNGKVHFSGNCYMSFASPRPGGNAEYIDHILSVGHGSVLEHAVWNFAITGISRSLSHELVRHRAGVGFSQLSQRYVDESVAEYVEPDIIANDPVCHQLWLDAVTHAHTAYLKLSERLSEMLKPAGERRADVDPAYAETLGVLADMSKTERRKSARQAARSVLPNATETKIFLTANARALRHIIELRGSRQADPEIRKLAVHILSIMQVESPNIFGDYAVTRLSDGSLAADTEYRKV